MASTWASKCPRHWQRVGQSDEAWFEAAPSWPQHVHRLARNIGSAWVRAKKKTLFAPYFQRFSIVNLIVHLSATDRCEIQVYNSYAVSPGTRGASWIKILNRLGAQVGLKF